MESQDQRPKMKLTIAVILVLSSFNCLKTSGKKHEIKTNRPVFGILSLNVWNTEMDWFKCSTYVGASYVKFIEMAGARVVPIRLDLTEEKLEKSFQKLNGIVLPGGNNAFPSHYGDTAKWFINRAIKANDEGEYFPIIGMCLGYLALFNVTSKDTLPTVRCSAMNYAINVNFEEDYKKSRLFGSLPSAVNHNLQTQNMTYHHHEKCVTRQLIEDNKDLSDFWRVLTTNFDRNGLEFVSTAEAKNYPFYALSWHPEKISFEWTVTDNYSEIPHSIDAVSMAQNVANFIATEARRNDHHFLRAEVESAAVVNNYKHMFLQHYPLVYDAIYCIKERVV